MDATALQYKSSLCVAGTWFVCVEDYESVHARIRDAQMKATTTKKNMALDWAPPIELTIRGQNSTSGDERPLRAAINPLSISMVYEIPTDWQQDVAE